MDAAEQLRILEETKGHPGRLALATVDLVHVQLTEKERATMKMALKAAAIPHWVDETILSTLLPGQQIDVLQLLASLRNLSVVENFPARGERAANVHEATRKALRKMLQEEEPDFFRSVSARAREAFAGQTAFHLRIEALYHLFAVDQEAAATECSVLDNEATVTAGPQAWQALAGMLSELVAEKWLSGRALLYAMLSINECRLDRGETGGVEAAAQAAIDLATKIDDPRGGARAHGLLGDFRIMEGNLDLALQEFYQTRDLYERVIQEHPTRLDWQRERNVAYSRIGDVLLNRQDFDAALTAYRTSLAGAQAIVSSDASIAGALREVGVGHSKIGDVLFAQGDSEGAWVEFDEHRKIAERLLEADPESTIRQRDLAVVHSRLGDVYFAQGRLSDAADEYQKDLTTSQRLLEKDPTNLDRLHSVVVSLYNLALVLARLGRTAEALVMLRDAEKNIQTLIATGATNSQWKRELQSIQEMLQQLSTPDPGPASEDKPG